MKSDFETTPFHLPLQKIFYMELSFTELNLSKPLINALTDLEFIAPTPIQKEAYPIIMSGKDVIGIAQTGTGKTFAYLLPILRQLKFSNQRHPRVLILVPTRELVVQVLGEIKKLTTYMNVRVEGIYGGTNINTQKERVYQGLDILVATPGRLIDLNLTGVLRLKSIQQIVIDEVDEMLHLGFRTQIIQILEMIPEKRQHLMFSATLTDDVDALIQDYFYEPYRVEIAPHGTTLDQIEQRAFHVPNFYTKLNLLLHFMETEPDFAKVLVFTGTKRLADRIEEELQKKSILQAGVLHSNKSQNLRLNTLKRFHEGEVKFLIATDIVARGLDVSDVSHVVNFDFPEEPADYIHRIGRTGRADKSGIAISFINEKEQPYQEAVEALIGKAIPVFPIPEVVPVSPIFTEEERPSLFDKPYLKAPGRRKGGGAFHAKKTKAEKSHRRKR